VATYLVERYVPLLAADRLGDIVARAEAAAARATEAGAAVRHLRSFALPADETCLSLYEADSAEAVAQAQEDLPYDRIVPAVL
jgi:hypothetical protein